MSSETMRSASAGFWPANEPNVPHPALLASSTTRAPSVSASAASRMSNDMGSVRSRQNGLTGVAQVRTSASRRSARRATAQISSTWQKAPESICLTSSRPSPEEAPVISAMVDMFAP